MASSMHLWFISNSFSSLVLASERRLILLARSDAIESGDEETFVVSEDGSTAIVQQVTTLKVRQPLGAKPEVRN